MPLTRIASSAPRSSCLRGHPDLYEDCRPKGARRSWDGNVIIKVEVACNEVWVGGRFERDNLLHIESSPMQRSNVNDKAVRVIVTCQRGNLLMKWPGRPPGHHTFILPRGGYFSDGRSAKYSGCSF